MSGRVYRLPMVAVSLGTTTGGVDLWAVTTSSTVPIAIEEIRLDPNATSISDFTLSMKTFTSTYTAGLAGSALTPVKTLPNDAAAVTTCKTINTTKTLVGTGAVSTQDAGAWNLVNGWAWQPIDPDHRIVVPVSACFVLSLDTTPASQTANGCMIIRELV